MSFLIRLRFSRKTVSAVAFPRASVRAVVLFLVLCLAAWEAIHCDDAIGAPLISTAPSWQATGTQAGADFGSVATTAGDVNGDGFSDLLVGAPSFDGNDVNEGRVFVYFGSPTGLATSPSQEVAPLPGSNFDLNFGSSLACLGDVDGDGYDDVAIGAPNFDTHAGEDAGAVALFYGSRTGLREVWNAIEGTKADANFGCSVSHAGDVNGDGYLDLIVGERFFSNGQASEGRALVYAGSSEGITSSHWSVEGNAPGIRFGETVCGAGDVNADGFGDILVCASRFTNGENAEGKVDLYLGSPSGIASSSAWTYEGNQVSASLGVTMAAAGDVNGDGFADVLIGSPNFDDGQVNEGQVLLFLGFEGGLKPNPHRTFQGNQDFANLGSGLGTAGDVNGDGVADLLLGAEGYDSGATDAGRVQLHLGGSIVSGTPDFVFAVNVPAASFGASAITAGDVNGDGFSDVVCGAPGFDGGKGGVFVFHGAAATFGTHAQQDAGRSPGASLGECAEVIGDMNGDGFDDLLVIAPWEERPGLNGEGYLYPGREGGVQSGPTLSSLVSGIGFSAAAAAARDLNGDGFEDFVVAGISAGRNVAAVFAGGMSGPSHLSTIELGARLGRTISVSAGDLNGDGYGDLLLGDPFESSLQELGGVARVYYGSRAGFDSLPDWEVRGDLPNQQMGVDVEVVGDVNGDGFDDALISQVDAPGGPFGEGRTVLYLGSVGGLQVASSWAIQGGLALEGRGEHVAAAGDVNGDGRADVLIGTPAATRVEIFHGSAAGLEPTPRRLLAGPNSFGIALSTAGDVNLDGFSDILIGAPDHLLRQTPGYAFLFLGSNGGIGEVASLTLQGFIPGEEFGMSVTGGGDLSGDGFADIAIGAPSHPILDEAVGFMNVYLGNESSRHPRTWSLQTFPDRGKTGLGGRTGHPGKVYLEATLRTPAGRDPVAFTAQFGNLLGPVSRSTTSDYVDSGPIQPGNASSITVTELLSVAIGSNAHFRFCTRSRNPYFPRSPWTTFHGNGPRDTKVRFLEILPVSDAPSSEPSIDGLMLSAPAPNPTAENVHIRFALDSAARVRIDVMDVVGRRVATILDDQQEAGMHSVTWQGRSDEGVPLPSGMYFVRASAEGSETIRKVVLRR